MKTIIDTKSFETDHHIKFIFESFLNQSLILKSPMKLIIYIQSHHPYRHNSHHRRFCF